MTTYSTHRKKGFRWLFALVTVITLAVPYFALGAASAFRNSETFGVSNSRRQPFFSHRSRFFGGDEFDGLEVTVEQSQPVPKNPRNLPKSVPTFSHTGWTAATEWRS
jgi:hypothetical protein